MYLAGKSNQIDVHGIFRVNERMQQNVCATYKIH